MTASARQHFRQSTESVWATFAREVGGASGTDETWSGDKITAHDGEWVVTLDAHALAAGYTSVTLTRIRAPYVNRDGFLFRVHHRDLFSAIESHLGLLQDIHVGDKEFDRRFIIQGNDETKVQALFADARIRERLLANPDVNMMVKKDEGWFGARFPEGVDELYLEVPGVVRQVARLRALYDLFSETLNHLCLIGSAYSETPGVKL